MLEAFFDYDSGTFESCSGFLDDIDQTQKCASVCKEIIDQKNVIVRSEEFLGKDDKVLLIDDFLANGKALEGLSTLVQDSGAELVGAGVVIEKGFQVGGQIIRDRGIHLESLAIV